MSLTKKENILVAILNDSRYQFVFFSLCIYLIAVFEYQNFVIGKYEYMGFRNHFDFYRAIISGVLFFGSTFLVFLRSSDFIKGITGLLVVLMFMPILVVYQFDTVGLSYVIATMLLVLFINFKFKLILLKSIRFEQRQMPIILFLLALVLFIPFLLTYTINFDLNLFKFGEEIYEVREAIKGKGNVFTGYLLSPLIQVVIPIMAIYGLIQRKFYFTIIAVLLTIITYLMMPQKSIFLGIFVVLFFYFFKQPLRKVAVFTGLVLSLLLLGVVLTYTSDSIVLESLLLRRYFIIPAYLNHVYLEFFDKIPLQYSYSFLSGFYKYPFEVGPTFLIGDAAFGSIKTNANNGFMSDAFINFGLWGMFGFTLIVGLIIKFFDELSIDAKFFGLFFLLINLFRSTALPTMVLTHGLWLLILLSFVVLRNTLKKSG